MYKTISIKNTAAKPIDTMTRWLNQDISFSARNIGNTLFATLNLLAISVYLNRPLITTCYGELINHAPSVVDGTAMTMASLFYLRKVSGKIFIAPITGSLVVYLAELTEHFSAYSQGDVNAGIIGASSALMFIVLNKAKT